MEDFLSEKKIEGKVYDRRTLMAIYKLMKKGIIHTLESTIKEGKESVIVSAKNKEGKWLAVKIYRVEHCDFKSMWKYLVSDYRFERIRKDRWHVVINWAKREFKNMKIAFEFNVSLPEPFTVYQNILVMSFIGENGIPAPNLAQLEREELDWKKIYDEVKEEMFKLAKAKLIHTDLSAFNILYFDKVYLIDFSQAVTDKHPLALQFLERDVKNINNFFKKMNVEIDENLFEKLKEVIL
ncbi:MAG: serine protein kinase RIO [Candidatus Aenigmatarchaeota archaeon]